jgi:hypothetical protein
MSTTSLSRTLLAGGAALMAIVCTSCGSPAVYPVSGKILYKGSPAAGAAVVFRRAGTSPANAATEPIIRGIVQADGSFELTCGSLGQGAPAGEYDVLVEWRRPIPRKQGAGCCCGRPQHGPDVFRGRYADPEHPLLRAKVDEQATQLPSFDLTDSK